MPKTFSHLSHSASALTYFALTAGVVCACGGQPKDASSANDEWASDTPSAESSALDEPEPQASALPESEAEPAIDSQDDSAPASSRDLADALQVVLMDEALLSQLNLEEPGRFPLKISGSSLSEGMELQARTEMVEVVAKPEDPKTEPVLVFTQIKLNSKSGTFKYRYDIEGIRGSSYVSRAHGNWVLDSSRISQY